MEWIKYDDKKPEIGELVICYRDIESRQIFSCIWSIEEENYAELNNITYWFPIKYPPV